MKAVRWHGRRDVRVDDIADPPPPGHNELQLEVLACGLCGTDVEEYQNGPLFVASEPHPLTGRFAPIVMGHEFAGRVCALGSGVANRAVGDLVAVAPDLACGACAYCTNGRPHLCSTIGSLGLSADGGLAERCTVPASTTVVLPEHTAPEAGALIETLAVVLHALRRGRVGPDDRVLVLGGGAVGLLAVQAAAASGVRGVILVDPLEQRRTIAAAMGAETLDPSETGAEIADVVLECSGAASAISTAVTSTTRGGRIVLVGLHAHEVALDALHVVARELEVLGSLSYVFDEDYVAAARLVIDGAVDVEAIITDRIPLARSVEDGLLALLEHPHDHVKIIVQPSGGLAYR